MDILNVLLNQINNKELLGQLGKSVDAKPEQVQKLAQVGLPTLFEALSRNASTKDGALALSKALDQHQNQNVDDVKNFLKHADTQDGSKILEHILGNNNAGVQKKLAASAGLSVNQVGGLLSQFAPMIMAFLGNQKKQKSSSEGTSTDVASLLGSLLGGAGSAGLLGMATKFLDADGDGDVMDDLGKMFGGLFKK